MSAPMSDRWVAYVFVVGIVTYIGALLAEWSGHGAWVGSSMGAAVVGIAVWRWIEVAPDREYGRRYGAAYDEYLDRSRAAPLSEEARLRRAWRLRERRLSKASLLQQDRWRREREKFRGGGIESIAFQIAWWLRERRVEAARLRRYRRRREREDPEEEETIDAG